MTPEELRQKTALLKQQAEALKEYWLQFIGKPVPADRQFHIWINLYGFDVTASSLEAMVARIQQWLTGTKKPIDLERLVKYVYGIAKNKAKTTATSNAAFEIEEEPYVKDNET